MINVRMNKYYVQLLLIVLTLFSNISIGFAISPEDVVKQFCDADLKGARLSGKTYTAVRGLVLWTEEPGWDAMFITGKIQIINAKNINKYTRLIEVKYGILGLISGDDFINLKFNELIDFVLVKQGNKWKIKEPIFPPHVSISSAEKNVKDIIAIEKNSNRIEKLKDLYGRLENLSE